MKHTTKILAVIMSVCMLLSFMPAVSFADEIDTWAVYNDTDKTLTFCVGTKTDAGVMREGETEPVVGDAFFDNSTFDFLNGYYSDWIDAPWNEYLKETTFYYFDEDEEYYEEEYYPSTDVVEVIILDDISPESTAWWFSYFEELRTISGIEKLKTENVTDMSYMFYQCSSLIEINLDNFNTENVTNMEELFGDCSSLTELDVKSFRTGNVTTMRGLFSGCSSLTKLDVTYFDTSKVTNMNEMFRNCRCLTELDVTHFDTGNVTDMGNLFNCCFGLTELDVTHFNTSSVINMEGMFVGCSSLTELDVTHFDTRNVTNMSGMFGSCYDLIELDTTQFETGNVIDLSGMFAWCRSLARVDVSGFDTSKVENMRTMFYMCSSLTELDVSNFDTSNVTNMENMFAGILLITELDVSNFDTGNVFCMRDMFYCCHNVTALDVSHFDTSNVLDMGYMFCGCSTLTELDVANFDTKNVTNMDMMFDDCSALTKLDVSHFDTGNVIDMQQMFCGCSGLTKIDVSGFKTENVIYMGTMFGNCSGISSLDLSNFDTSNVQQMCSMFASCSKLNSITFGEKFEFKEYVYDWGGVDTARLPQVSSENPHTGYWISDEHPGMRFTSAELMENYDGATMAGTWVWETLKDLNDALILPIPDQDYTGSEITPAVTINYLGTTLTENTDYTLSYSNNVYPGQATVTVTGISPYAGTVSVNFNIVRGLSGAAVSASDQNYSGSALTPNATVTLDGNTLSSDTDYDLVYVNNTDPGAATMIVTGKGYYKGMSYGTFRINQDAPVVPDKTDLSGALVTAADQDYTGSALTPAVTVTLNGSPLDEGTDFTVRSYERNTDVGTAVVFISGIGDYEGVAYGTFLITENVPAKTDLSAATVSAADQDYTGSALTPAVTVTLNGSNLTENTDYNLVYVNNTDPGAATVIITGTGDYEGMAYGTFRITKEEPVVTPKTDLSAAVVTAADQDYSGSALTPAVTVTLNGNTLTENTDYNLVYVNNTDPGAATVIITGAGDYEGMAYGTFRITKEEPVVTPKTDLSTAAVTAADQDYTGSALTPAVSVTLNGSDLDEGTDYNLVYVNNTDVGAATVIITGTGDYEGMAYGTFRITKEEPVVTPKTDLSAAAVTAVDQEYTGSALTPAVSVTLNGSDLTEGTDYNLVYVNNTDAGAATVIITGTGDYEGMAYGTFRITKEEPVVTPKTNLSAAAVTAADQDYTGSALTPAVTVTLNGSDLDEGTDYNLVYVNNTDPGAATVIITGTGDYEGMAYGTFRITKEEPVVTPKTDLSESTVTADDQEYTGEALTPEALVSLRGSALREGTDYRTVYVNNTQTGTAVVIVAGIGDYTGMAYGTFEITGEGTDGPAPTEPSTDEPADSQQLLKQFSILDVMKRLFQSLVNVFSRVSG